MNKLTICELDELIKKNDEENRLAKNMIKFKEAEIANYINSWLIKKINIGPAMVYYYPFYFKLVFWKDNKHICVLFKRDKFYIDICLISKDNQSMVSVGEEFRRKYDLQKLYEFYMVEENTKKLFAQKDKIENLCSKTNYLDNLPKAYTFLLCSPFCRDITKIITKKILFFPMKKLKKEKERNGKNNVERVRRKTKKYSG